MSTTPTCSCVCVWSKSVACTRTNSRFTAIEREIKNSLFFLWVFYVLLSLAIFTGIEKVQSVAFQECSFFFSFCFRLECFYARKDWLCRLHTDIYWAYQTRIGRRSIEIVNAIYSTNTRIMKQYLSKQKLLNQNFACHANPSMQHSHLTNLLMLTYSWNIGSHCNSLGALANPLSAFMSLPFHEIEMSAAYLSSQSL